MSDREKTPFAEEKRDRALDETVVRGASAPRNTPDATRITGEPSGPAAPSQGGDSPARIGPYRVVRKLGGGGMGQIWLAVQESLGREVAIKVLPPGALDNPEAIARFQREAQVLGQLQHGNICPVLETGQQGSTHYSVMEYLRGMDFAKVLKTQRVDARRAVEIGAQMARALQFAHDKGIVHRDIKPHNIMIVRGSRPRSGSVSGADTSGRSLFGRLFSRKTTLPVLPGATPGAADSTHSDPHMPSPEWEDHAVLIDFGLARDEADRATRLTMTGAMVGTPAYMSPEQARGKHREVGPASDVYSLGAVLYEALALRPPFIGESVAEVVHHVIYDDPPRLRSLNPSLDRDVETIVQKALEKDPARRYASAGALAEDLERWMKGEPILARPASVVYRLRKRVARNPLAAAAILAAGCLGTGALWWAFAPGRIRIDSEPQGADIRLDGRVVGRTPWEGRCASGRRVLELKLADYEPEVEGPVVEPGRQSDVKRTLRHEQGSLRLSSSPPQIAVDLKHTRSGKTVTTASPASDLSLDTGEWTGVAHARNHFSRALSFTLAKGDKLAIHITLNPLTLWERQVGPGDNWHLCDVDRDGGVDIVTATDSPPSLSALRGEDGSLLWYLDLGRSPAASILREADFDGDLMPEIVFADRSGRVLVVDAATGVVEKRFDVEASDVQVLGDVTGDGIPEFVIAESGRVSGRNGASGEVLWAIPVRADLHPMTLARLNRDEFPDLILSENLDRARGIDGRTGQVLWTADAQPKNPAIVLDVDGDGIDDLCHGHAIDSVRMWSGADGHLIWERKHPKTYDQRPWTVAADVDGDGVPEIMHPCEDGIWVLDSRTGEVKKTIPLGLSWGSLTPCDANADGCDDLIVPVGGQVVAWDVLHNAEIWRTSEIESTAPFAADLNRDGRQDVALRGSDGRITVISAEEPPIAWRQDGVDYHTFHVDTMAGGDRLLLHSIPSRILRASDGLVLEEFGNFRSSFGCLTGAPGKEELLRTGERIELLELAAHHVRWSVPGVSTLTDPQRFDLNGDGIEDVVAGDAWGRSDLAAFDGRDGATLWQNSTPRVPHADAQFIGGLLWIASIDGLLGLDPLTGLEKARVPTIGVPRTLTRIGDEVAFATTEGRMLRLSLPAPGGTASVRWDVETGVSPTRPSPVCAGGFLASSGWDGQVILGRADTGELLWRRKFPIGGAAGPALRDLDGDGLPEVAYASEDGWVRVLDGRDGRTRWKWHTHSGVADLVPTWIDVDGDRHPELLLPGRTGFLHAFRLDLTAKNITVRSGLEANSPRLMGPASLDARDTSLIREAEVAGRWADVVSIARENPTPFSCLRAAFAARAAGDDPAALDFADRAAVAGVRRFDLALLRAGLHRDAASRQALVLALATAPLDELGAAIAHSEEILRETATDAANVASAAGEWERCLLLRAAAGGWAEAVASLSREVAADSFRLARARAALKLGLYEEARAEFEAALAVPQEAAEARDGLRFMADESAKFRKEGESAYGTFRRVDAAAAFERAARLNPASADDWGNAAMVQIVRSGASPTDLRHAVDMARRAIETLRVHAPDDLAGIAHHRIILGRVFFALGEMKEAAAAFREALQAPLTEDDKKDALKRLADCGEAGQN